MTNIAKLPILIYQYFKSYSKTISPLSMFLLNTEIFSVIQFQNNKMVALLNCNYTLPTRLHFIAMMMRLVQIDVSIVVNRNCDTKNNKISAIVVQIYCILIYPNSAAPSTLADT